MFYKVLDCVLSNRLSNRLGKELQHDAMVCYRLVYRSLCRICTTMPSSSTPSSILCHTRYQVCANRYVLLPRGIVNTYDKYCNWKPGPAVSASILASTY